MRVDRTDDRLDTLSERMDDRFKQVDHRFDRVETELHHLRGQVERGFEKSSDDLRMLGSEINGRFDSMQRALFLAASGVVIALIGVIATQL